MINDHVLSRFRPFESGLLRPIYEDYSFVNLPATLHFLLTGEKTGPLLPADCFGGDYPSPRRVVLLFIDSFGWRFWRRYAARSKMLGRIENEGIVTPISALFPSTTSASVTTLNFDLPPAAHGVYEWNLFVPAFGETIQSLPFTTLGERAVSCESLGHDINAMVPNGQTVHDRLRGRGVRSIQLAHQKYARSPYNSRASAGAEIVPHASLPEAFAHLRDALATVGDRALINLYWASLDSAAHVHGPDTPGHVAEIERFLRWLDQAFEEILLDGSLGDDTLLMVTADHGQTGADAAETIYLNENLPILREHLARNAQGETILPNGAPRDVFLHIAPMRRAETLDMLARFLGDRAVVSPVETAIEEGLFGAWPIAAETRRRMGDILVLPRDGHFIWWREPERMENVFHGHHGGLSANELISLTAVWAPA